jgi:hypothetical protein
MVFAWILSRNRLQPLFPVLCKTFHRTRPRLPPYERKSNPFRTKGRYFISTTQVQASTATFFGPKELAEGILEADNRPIPRLNRFLLVPHFKMETTMSVAAVILPGDWAVSLDLRDTYLHVPVHPDYQHYLQFYFEGRVHHFKAMPFGLASAPLIFQSIVKGFVAPLHTLGLQLHFYLL